ncbi:MAG: tRNA (adenosine(37)-N6)-dimethylallyltransferase MiaA, partial [Candidatus Sungiibacteriota bacterium]
GEIISADSRQVYIGLDIGTGKVPGKWRTMKVPTSKPWLASWKIHKKKVFVYKGVPHHCIDFVPPRKVFSAADFKRCAENAIKDITARGKIPILAGGTGFYLDAVVYDMALPEVSPNKKLRKTLEQKKPALLFAMLKKLDHERAKTIDAKNPRRLIRAIEIAKALGRVPKFKKRRPYRALWLGIKFPTELLYSRIHARLTKRMREGMIEEARRLHKNGLGWARFYALGLEYRYLADYVRGKVSAPEMRENLETAIRHYARRQMVWFKRNPEIHWLNDKKEAEKLLRLFLRKN